MHVFWSLLDRTVPGAVTLAPQFIHRAALFREVRDAGTMAGIVRRSCDCGRDPRGQLVGADLAR
jgi:hypothetical protein